MLQVGKFPSFASVVAILAVILLVFTIVSAHSINRSALVANVLELVVMAVTALSCFSAARRSTRFPRQVWTLLAIAFTLEALAQAISVYYEAFVPNSYFTPEPSDILFFIWAAPIFIIFLPPPEEESSGSGLDGLRILDFLQVAVVALTMYLYFFYSPARWRTGESAAIVRQILLVYILRDLLLALGFYLRSRSSRASWFRSFSLVLAVTFLAGGFADGDYLLTLNSSIVSATRSYLFWTVPHLIVLFFALSWKTPESAGVALPPSRVGNFFAQQFLPLGLPLLVIFMGQAIAHEQFYLGWLAVVASVLCSSARLILTNRKTRYVAEELLSTEKALRRSEQMLSTAFRSSPDAFSINIFPNGPYLEVNEGFTLLTGYTREETLGKRPSDINLWINPADREPVLAQLLQTGDARDFEFQFRHKSGQTRVGLMSASLIELDSRTCVLVVVRDITARKEAEEILRTSEERFRSLVQNLHVGVVIYNPDGRIVFANQAVVDLLRMPADFVLGKTSIELNLTPLREDGIVIRDDQRPIATVLATHNPVRGLLIGWRIPTVPETAWTLLDAVPEFSSSGDLLRVVVTVTDLTEQRRAAEALRESEERFRTLVSDLHVAVVLHSPNGLIEYANAAAYRMFDVPENAALGKTPAEFGIAIFEEDGTELPPDQQPVASVLSTRLPISNGLLALRHPVSGKLIWVFGNAVPQFDSAGNLIRVITTFADVSDMKNAERAIHQLSTQLLRLQDEERRRIGRELHDGLAQTVLAINLSLAQVRQSLTSEDPRASRALEKARSLTQQMSREIRTLSYLLHPPLLDDLGLVSALREYAQGFSERSSIDTQLQVLSEFTRLPEALELALFRIVQESLANIQRHSGSPSSVIRLRQEASLITLEIIDFGHGIAPTSGIERKQPRYGVGIPGMRERISQLGGRLDIISGPTGTTVRATISLSNLPVTPAPDTATTSTL